MGWGLDTEGGRQREGRGPPRDKNGKIDTNSRDFIILKKDYVLVYYIICSCRNTTK